MFEKVATVFSICLLFLLISNPFITTVQAAPTPDFDKQFQSCVAGTQYYNEKKCDRAKKELEEFLDAIDDACKDAGTFEQKKGTLYDLLEVWINWGPWLADEKLLAWDELCGAFLWEENTWVQLYTDESESEQYDPLTLRLEIGEEIEVKARIITSICQTSDKATCGEEFELPYPYSWEWASSDEEVFEIEREYSSSGSLKIKGAGSASLVVMMPDFTPDPNLLLGYADVIVGQGLADVVFVIDNHFNNNYHFGAGGNNGDDGLRQKGQLILDEGLKKYLGEDSRTAIVTYNNPLIFPYNTYYYFDNDAECQEWFGPGVTISNPGITDYLPFSGLLREEEIVSAWESLQVFCGDSDDYYYQRTAVYSALMHAMDDVSLGSWRTDDPEVSKIIILLGNHPPAGPYYPLRYRENNPEELTGLTDDDVISRAQQQNISIHVLNFSWQDWLVEGYSGESAYSEGMRGTFTRFAQETGGTYVETEYPAPTEYAGPNLYLGIVEILRQVTEED